MRLLLKNPGGTFLQIQAEIYFCVANILKVNFAFRVWLN